MQLSRISPKHNQQ